MSKPAPTATDDLALLTLLNAQRDERTYRQAVQDALRLGPAQAIRERITPEPTLFNENPAPIHELPAEYAKAQQDARDQLNQWRHAHATYMSLTSAEYPSQLANVPCPPPFVFYTGSVQPEPMTVSIMGTSLPMPEMVKFTQATVTMLAVMGKPMSIVSTLDRGIAATALKTAMKQYMRVIGVLPAGPTVCFPSYARDLYEWVWMRGMLASTRAPEPHGMPRVEVDELMLEQRDMLVSAYGQVSLIVAADERGEVARYAHMVRRQGRPLVLTDEVARTTRWGKLLSGEQRVCVVSSPRDAAIAIARAPGV